MYKKDKQGMIIVLIALTLFLAISIGFKFQSAVAALSIALVVVLVQLLSNLHQRLTHLEQQFSQQKKPLYSIHTQTIVIYAAALVALVAYMNHWMWIAGGAFLVLLLCLVQTISAFHTRLLYLESVKQTVHVNETLQTEIITPALEQVDSNNTDMLIPVETSVLNQEEQPAQVQSTWWQPAVDWMVHGNPILRVAVAVLMVGVVLLLRFASEHWQLSLGVKLGFIAIAGGVLTAFGYSLQKKNQLFAVALQGVGLAVVFLTLVFSHHFGVIANLMTASILFTILLAITVFLSLKQKAIYLAILALGMAYAAPLVIPQYRPDVVFLFSYYLVINLAVAAVNFIQPWKILNQIAFFATMFIGGSAIGFYAEPAKFDTLDWILWLHIALFIWLSVRYSQNISRVSAHEKQEGIRLPPLLDVGLIFSVPVLGFTLHAYLVHESTQALTIGAAVLAGTYAVLTFWIKKTHPQLSVLAKSFFILAVAFFALIFPLAKGAHWTAIGWVAQGTALIVWGVTERYRLSRYIGVILVLLSSVALFYQFWANAEFPTLSTSIYAMAQFISAFYLLQYNSKEQHYFSASMFSGIFLCLGMYAGAIAGIEILTWKHHGLSPYLMIAILLLSIFSVVVHYKLRVQWQSLQLSLISLLLLLILGEAFTSQVFSMFKWPSILQQGTFLIAAMLLSALFITAQPQSGQFGYLKLWAGLSWLALAVTGLAIFPQMPIVALAFVPVVYSFWAYKTHKTTLLHQIPVWCLSLVWLLVVSVDMHSAQYLYFIPLINLTDFLSIVVFAGLLFIIYQHTFDQDKSLEWTFKITTILVGLLVFSSVVVRGLHHYWATPLWSAAIWTNGVVQLSLTLLWVILAFILTTFSSRKMIRQLWFVGAALLGIVVLKLILLDLSQSATLTRVISFIAAGGVMLIIAYLAPLPPSFAIQKNEEPKL
ncbi:MULTISPECIES: DUF2339 domain-containing protein [Acinetobacter]|uniref:DUF2339 domain-containing protein n=1 Tax=Acinetobacter TaxID=469 RepID=UPI00029C990B|nr:MULTISPECIES: DUF2339 domain-containing protein [Acinetobacter]EKU38503.1 membrane protein, PF10101 family [Acinetobacter sp. WC-141]MBM7141259.1 DUF2339 domain-containing protein [Acinetobacter sp. 105-3]